MPSILRQTAVAALAVASAALPAVSAAPASAAVPALERVFENLRAGAVNAQGTIDQAMSSPAFGDVTGDAVPDIVVGSMDGILSVFDPRDGTVLRRVTVQSGAMIQAAPALSDITGDGVSDVVVGTVLNTPGQSRVKAYDMTGGASRLVFDKGDSGLDVKSGFFGAPTVGDIDGDGAKEIVAVGLDHHLHAWNVDGSSVTGFPVYTYDTSLSSPALSDIDGDGAKDIVVGADMDSVNQPLPAGGYLWAVRGNGQTFPGYPLRLSSEVVWSSPAVGDVNGDGRVDAVVGTGRNFGGADQNRLYAVDLLSRQPLAGWPVTLSGNTMGSPALANLDGDPQPEVVTTTGDGRVHRVEANGTKTWAACAHPTWLPCPGDTAFIGSPVIADVDTDADAEIVVSVNRELLVLSAATGSVEFRETIRSNPGDYAHPTGNAPAVANVAGRAYVTVNVQVDNGDDVRNTGDRQGVYAWRAPQASQTLPWAQFHRGQARQGSVGDAAPSPVPAYVDAVYGDLLGRPATAQERQYWAARIAGGLPRGEFTRALARSPEWTGHVVTELYRQVFDREPDSGGKAYWSDLVSRGMRVSYVASHFYGSDEWFRRQPPTGGGGTVDGFVDNLYRRVLERAPDSQRAYWVDLVNGGTSRVTVSAAFYLSYESNAKRVDSLYRTLLGRPSEAAGRDYWTRQLERIDDIELAAQLTASDEYFAKNS